ncbi:MAG: YabP/YqfC family sporulation protein [Ruminococcus sp.]|nr:YabP/YqfC family sporulation protein [Ruminococcus sp.]
MFERLKELTREKLCLNSDMHISGKNELILDNCEKIEECNEVYMRLLSGTLRISIRGSCLRAYDFRTGGIVIRGNIEQIEFSERSSRNGSQDTKICQDKCSGEKTQ